MAHAIGKQLASTLNGSLANLDVEQLSDGIDSIAGMKGQLRDAINAAIGQTKTPRAARSSNWLTTAVPAGRWHELKNVDGDYYAAVLTSPSQINDALVYVPKNAAVLQLCSSLPLENVLRHRLGPDVTLLAPFEKNAKETLTLFGMLGQLYMTGTNLDIEKLYTKVSYPVPRGTLPISPAIQWDHYKSCAVTKHPEYFNVIHANSAREIDTMQTAQQYLMGHVIDGRHLVPAVEYLRHVWENAVGNIKGE